MRERERERNNRLFATQKFDIAAKDLKPEANRVIMQVYEALREKGYDPVIQIVGYILSGDPTYITAHKNARTLIGKLERDELLEEVVNFYLENNG